MCSATWLPAGFPPAGVVSTMTCKHELICERVNEGNREFLTGILTGTTTRNTNEVIYQRGVSVLRVEFADGNFSFRDKSCLGP